VGFEVEDREKEKEEATGEGEDKLYRDRSRY
jgi:hypothetical protein